MGLLDDIEDYRSNDLSGNYTIEELSMKMDVPVGILAEMLEANSIFPTEQLINDEFVEVYTLSQFDNDTQQAITNPPVNPGGGVIINNVVHWKAFSAAQNVNTTTNKQPILFQGGSTPNTDAFSNVTNGVQTLKDLYNVRITISLYYQCEWLHKGC